MRCKWNNVKMITEHFKIICKLNSNYRSSSRLNRFLTCLNLQRNLILHVSVWPLKCGQPTPVLLGKLISFLATILEHIHSLKITACMATGWAVTLLHICHILKFIRDDYLHETMTMWTDAQTTTTCFSNTCWLLLLLTAIIVVRVTNF